MRCNSLSKLYIHACNIHNGGGKELLYSFLRNLPDALSIHVLVDIRMPIPTGISSNITIKNINPTLFSRLNAERWLAKNARYQDLVFCFGNLPPLFRVKAKVVVFVQNRYLIENISLIDFPLKTRFRIGIERLWLALRFSTVSEFIVQTNTMKLLLTNRFNTEKIVSVVPYVNDSSGYFSESIKSAVNKVYKYDFIYVASGEPHKNHKKLIEAWCLLSIQNLYPTLCLTVDKEKSPQLYKWIKSKEEQYNLKLFNMGYLSKDKIGKLYINTKALIYPSVLESFGMPLIEARQAGLSILAPELDYVRDILDPEQVFDPCSAISIERAVKRFLDVKSPVLPLLNAGEFVKYITNKIK